MKSIIRSYLLKINGFPFKIHNKMMNSNTWRGVPITEIYGSQTPWGAPEFALVTPAYNHAVLYHISSNGVPNDKPPSPQIGQDKWDHDHVRLPCSGQSLYPVENGNGEKRLKKRWEIIENTLSKPIKNSKELAEAILSYNTKFKNIWKFRALHKLFNEYLEEEEAQYFFEKTLPSIAKLALDLPSLIRSPIPLLRQHKNRSLSLSQQQIASLLANAFFCTFPRRNTSKRDSEYSSYPHINFSSLYNTSGLDCVLEKLKCICHYFRKVCSKVPVGVVTFSRRSVPVDSCPNWADSSHLLGRVPLHIDSATYIEDAHGLIQVDFANKFLGGGVLGTGCVQEEIRFVICPELLVSMLFTEVMDSTEAVMIIGCEQYSRYAGYGDTFHWAGDCTDETPRDASHRRRCAVLAIDALRVQSHRLQYNIDMVTRELNKAWVGFSFGAEGDDAALHRPGIATGNWGSGAFGGCPRLKSLLQMAACAQAGRPVSYYTFGDVQLRNDIGDMHDLLARRNVTVGQLFGYIKRFSAAIGQRKDIGNRELFVFIRQLLINLNNDCTDSNMEATVTKLSNGREPLTIKNQADFSMQKDNLNDSIDMFSEDDMDGTSDDKSMSNDKLTIVKDRIESQNTNTSEVDSFYETSENATKSSASSKRKMADGENKMAAKANFSCERPSPNIDHTSRLFDEMQNLDDENGRLNLSSTNSSFFGKNMSVSYDPPKETDAASELKKRASKKITDYFSKKPF